MCISNYLSTYCFLVDKCTLAPKFTLDNFKWKLPQSCYGSCMHPAPYHKRWFRCDLPCLSYDGTSNPRECLIRGGYTDPHMIFNRDANRFDCKDCTKADWKSCWPTQPPSSIFGWIESKVISVMPNVMIRRCNEICK